MNRRRDTKRVQRTLSSSSERQLKKSSLLADDQLLLVAIVTVVFLICLTEMFPLESLDVCSTWMNQESSFLPSTLSRNDLTPSEVGTRSSKNELLFRPPESQLPVIDIISIGSQTRPEYQETQQATFAQHPAVRTFLRVTELDDTEQECLEHADVELVFDICHRKQTYKKHSLMKRHFAPKKWLLENHDNPQGWLCAQKRPLDALHIWQNKLGDNELPDYLMIVDDDTWLNLDRIIPKLMENHPVDDNHVVAGCLIRSPKDENYGFHWGGFGLFWTRATVERLMLPLHCDEMQEESQHNNSDATDFSSDDEFAAFACKRIELSQVGEKHFFQSGMSILELMYEYGAQQPYTKANVWEPDASFCMHSDTTVAYFLQYYHVGDHAGTKNFPPLYESNPLERIIGFEGSTKIKISYKSVLPPIYDSREQCEHLSDDTCPNDAYLCHYVTPEKMERLYENEIVDFESFPEDNVN